MKLRFAVVTALLGLACAGLASQQGREKLDKIEKELQADVPKILCINEKFATAGQPTDTAFAKLAANGFKSVLSLRTGSEGVDLDRERSLVEAAGMRYIGLPVVSSAPRPEQVDEFFKAVQDSANQPMLIHCGSANRVGAFWMIYRAVVQNVPENEALEEATRIGLVSPVLKSFAQEQIAKRKKGS
jgi:uncharacterized protein (TIGR01244 family)